MLTGATGFIGSHIAERLIQKKINLQLFTRRRNGLIDLFEKRGATIYVAQPDNMEILRSSLKDADVIIHCAGATKALRDSDYIKANVEFTTNLLNAANKQQRFVFISSQAAAGPSDSFIPIDENAEPNPLTYYGKSKLMAENHIKEWGKANNNYVILRPSVVYGPGEKDILNFFKLVNNGILLLLGNGKKRFSILHVHDLVNAVMICADHPSSGETYFVCNDKASSWEELGLSIKNALKRAHALTFKVPEHMAWVAGHVLDVISLMTQRPSLLNGQKIIEAKQAAWLCSNSKIKDKLKWNPEITLEKGIKQTADWYIQRNWI